MGKDTGVGSTAVAALARRYRGLMASGTLLFVVLCGLTLWGSWESGYASEVDLAVQRVQKDAIRLKAIIKAASDHVQQTARWTEDFPDHAPYPGPADLRLAARQALDTSANGEINLDVLSGRSSEQRLGLLIALTDAAKARPNGRPSNLDLALPLLDRFRYGQATTPFLRWSYFFSARKDVLAMAPWASSADVLGSEPNAHSFLQHSWTYEITERGLPENNPDRHAYWTKAYPDQAGAGLMVSYGVPVYWDKEFLGVVGADVLLTFLSDFLKEFPDPDGLLVIADQHGELLADRHDTVTQAKEVQSIDTVLPPALGPWSAGTIHGAKSGGLVHGYHVIRESIGDPQWTIVYLLPQSTVALRVAKGLAPQLALMVLLMIALGITTRFLRLSYVAPALNIAAFVASENEAASPAPPAVPEAWRPWVDGMVRAFRERRQYMADLHAANEGLEQRVLERTSALTAANARQAEIDREATNRLERRNWALAAHAAAAEALAKAETEADLIVRVCQAIGTQNAFTLALVGFAEETEGKPIRIVCAEGPAHDYAQKITLSWSEDRENGRGAAGTCIRTGQPQVVAVEPVSFGGFHDAASDSGFRSACVLPLTDGDKTFGVLAVYSSTSELFDAEMVGHLFHLADQLAFGIQSRAARHAHAELEQSLFQARKLETLGRLAGGVAHDFNNLLSAVLGFSEFIVADIPSDHPSNRHAQRIRSAAYRGKALVDQILAFTRQSEIKKNRFALAETISETMALLSPLMPSTLQLRSDIIAPDIIVEADKGQLGQVLMNLCVNARDAMAERSGCITVTMGETDMVRENVVKLGSPITGDAEVWTDSTGTNWSISGFIPAHGRYVSLIVSDNGPGMETAVLDRAFEPFFTTKSRAQGSGLGLAVVQGMVLNHGGAIIVRSHPGTGTDVEIVLPVVDQQPDPVQTAATAAAHQVHSRLLLIDDDQDAADPIAEILRRRGWEVNQCAGAVQALYHLSRDGRYDLVLSDQNMPGTCGTELIREIKRRHPGLPCVLFTGYDEQLDDKIALECGADALLNKPLDFATLSDVLAQHARQDHGMPT